MSVSLAPASDCDVAEYLSTVSASYIAELVKSGMEPAEAAEYTERSVNRFFVDGRLVDGYLMFRVESQGRKAGIVWVGPSSTDRTDHWWVWDIVIDEKFRGRGVGRKAMLLVESEARMAGATELGLNVFAHNTIAIRLYRSLGYSTTSMQMRKPMR